MILITSPMETIANHARGVMTQREVLTATAVKSHVCWKFVTDMRSTQQAGGGSSQRSLLAKPVERPELELHDHDVLSRLARADERGIHERERRRTSRSNVLLVRVARSTRDWQLQVAAVGASARSSNSTVERPRLAAHASNTACAAGSPPGPG
jgi:hypothetical protein